MRGWVVSELRGIKRLVADLTLDQQMLQNVPSEEALGLAIQGESRHFMQN